MDNRNRLSPIPLPGKQPVAQLVLHRCLAETFLLQPDCDFLLGFGSGKTGDEAGVDGDAVTRKSRLCLLFVGAVFNRDRLFHLTRSRIQSAPTIRSGNNLPNLQPELLRELKIPFVMRWHGHDGAGPVAHHHVVGHPDRNLLVIDRIDRVCAGEGTGLFLLQLGPLQLALLHRGGPVCVNCRLLGLRGDLLDERVLGRKHHVRRAKERVGTGSENTNLVTGRDACATGNLKVNLCALTPPDPVPLLFLDRLRPVDELQVVE